MKSIKWPKAFQKLLSGHSMCFTIIAWHIISFHRLHGSWYHYQKEHNHDEVYILKTLKKSPYVLYWYEDERSREVFLYQHNDDIFFLMSSLTPSTSHFLKRKSLWRIIHLLNDFAGDMEIYFQKKCYIFQGHLASSNFLKKSQQCMTVSSTMRIIYHIIISFMLNFNIIYSIWLQ